MKTYSLKKKRGSRYFKKDHYHVILILFLLVACFPLLVNGQRISMPFEPTTEYPFGRINPEASERLADYAELIGTCDCKSKAVRADGTWGEAVDMTWTFKYIMNGTAIQDQTFKADGQHSGSIRRYNSDSASWYVHWYSTASIKPKLSAYRGTKKGNDIVLYKMYSDIKAPDGTDLYYRLTFSDISYAGFDWSGDWVDVSEEEDKVLGSTWKISCVKQKN